MSRDFYVVLGVSQDADLDQIRSAYRKLVKLYHPDAKPQPADKFIELRRAYEALCEPEENADRTPESDTAKTKTPKPEEPLVVSDRRRPRVARRKNTPPLSEQRKGMFSELDDFFSGWVPGLYRQGRQTSPHKDLFVELVLSPAEARSGGMIPLQVPVELACGDCDGGLQPGLVCERCGGRGRVVEHHSIEISVPPGVPDGTQARLSLEDVGLPRVKLHTLVTIAR